MAQSVCGLAEGVIADIVTLDATHPSLAGRREDQIIDGWIFASRGDAVDCVWGGGVKVVEGGRHRLRDRARRQFDKTLSNLLA